MTLWNMTLSVTGMLLLYDALSNFDPCLFLGRKDRTREDGGNRAYMLQGKSHVQLFKRLLCWLLKLLSA